MRGSMDTEQRDIVLMKQALELARTAAEQGEVPVGALVVNSDTGEIVAGAYNLRENGKIATAHAEILAIEEACRKAGGWRLSGYTLYVTLEPCPMCAGAIINSRIDRVVYGVSDALAGCCGSVMNFNAYPFSHAFEVRSGVCEDECRAILQEFFEKRRK